MTAQLHDVRTDFDWQPQPAAAAVVSRLLEQYIRENPHIETLRRRMHEETGTRLIDWVDTIVVNENEAILRQLPAAGFQLARGSSHSQGDDDGVEPLWRHPAGIFPTIAVLPAGGCTNQLDLLPTMLTVKVNAIDDFEASFVKELRHTIEGQPGGQMQTLAVTDESGWVAAVERHGWQGITPPSNSARQIASAAKHRRTLAGRRRLGQSDAELFVHATALFDAAAADLGVDWACDLFFAGEREYWMSRNAAARVQYERQQRLGLGWGNHDHHTYRSSRECFAMLITFLERAGFECRERFYAGREAGWGAQVLEQPRARVVIFADVDLTPDEVMGDFAHEPLTPLNKLGTVGLWCRLHGEAFLAAGMHHLECQFDFDAVRQQLATVGVETMTPFTNWAHLKQAFTKGEIWPVAEERLAAALVDGVITDEQAAVFRRDGALGSHLEILERNDGFKGFNQTGISEIISRTDPRKATAH